MYYGCGCVGVVCAVSVRCVSVCGVCDCVVMGGVLECCVCVCCG